MKKNMGTADRIIRAVLAVAILVIILAAPLSTAAAVILGIIGIIFLATAIVGSCPLYLLFKISTRKAT
ncbi:YgaP family membrane protein [Salinispira pacifica]